MRRNYYRERNSILAIIGIIGICGTLLWNRLTPNTQKEILNKAEAIDDKIPGIELVTPGAELIECELESVVDGDTIWVIKNGERTKVRFIGIDTPESVHSDATKNNEFGVMASDFTKQMLANRDTVYLEYDEETQDRYGRNLAYVWIDEDINDFKNNCLNALIIVNGYAIDKVFEPNVKYSNKLNNLCNQAREEKAGLWKYEGFEELWKN